MPKADLVAAKNELSTHILLTNQESGCLIFEVTHNSQNVNKFNVYEEFSDQGSFSNHQDRVSKSKWGAVTGSVERHHKISGVE